MLVGWYLLTTNYVRVTTSVRLSPLPAQKVKLVDEPNRAPRPSAITNRDVYRIAGTFPRALLYLVIEPRLRNRCADVTRVNIFVQIYRSRTCTVENIALFIT